MLELADIFRLHGTAYREKFGDQMLPSHRRALRDIEQCRTPELGGQLYLCQHCDEARYSYHSCKNRHCPKCQNHQADDWLQQQSGCAYRERLGWCRTAANAALPKLWQSNAGRREPASLAS